MTNIKQLSYKSSLRARPFVKWAGGKGQIIDVLRNSYPAGLGINITKYAEPFVGGGAVLFDILSNYKLEEVYISDINQELIKTYTQVRDNCNALIKVLSVLESEHLSLSEVERKEYYYKKRERFNLIKKGAENDTEIAAIFIYLNKTCFNGLYRVNSKGEFNVPMGSYKKPTICDSENLLAVSTLLKSTNIVCGDYKLSSEFIDNKTFVYFDPPYRPLTKTSNFTSYTQQGFSDIEQVELAEFINKTNQRGACIVASNSDPKNTNKNDAFFDNLYQALSITRIMASRQINSSGAKRGDISELLISNI